jgi:CRISPR-associated exonuclease Cas4
MIGGWILWGVALAAGLVLLVAGWALWTVREQRQYGGLVQVDRGDSRSPRLRSEAWRMSGTPDELRRRPDGRFVPVEWKRRPAPGSGPFPSHRVQVWAYCLLVEENYGRSPPFGVVRYGDGVEYRIPWDEEARRELASVRRSLAGRYRGEATPSPGRCRGCGYRPSCDAAAA